MKMRFMSDLHLDFGPFVIPALDDDADTVLVLAGDVAPATKPRLYKEFIQDAVSRFKHVIWIQGNHEHYGSSIHRSIVKMKRAVGEFDNLSIAENEVVKINDVSFVCATLWTDLANSPLGMLYAQSRMNDYNYIRAGKGNPYQRKLLPQDTVDIHKVSLNFIIDSLAEADGKTVVVTHHAPSYKSIGSRFHGDDSNCAYASPLDGMIEDMKPDYWIHGHLHNTKDYNIGHTNVLVNPRGYCDYEENREFDPLWTIDLS